MVKSIDRSARMGTESIGKLLWSFSWPAIVGMLVNSLYNIVSRIFVGHGIGTLAIAATVIAFPIMTIMFAFAMLIGIGATALISIRLGENKKDEAEQIIGNAALLLIVLPLILTIIYTLYSEQILIFFGASAEVLPYAHDYTQIIMFGSVFGALSFGFNNFIRAQGNPKIAMLTNIFAAITNIIFNYVFIFKLGWGLKGSAFATILSQFLTMLWVLGYFILGYSELKFRLKYLKPKLSVTFMTMTIGFAPFGMHIAQSVQQTILNRTLFSYGGDIAISAVGIIMSIGTILFMPIVGLSQGAQPIIGYNYGANQYERVKETLKKAVLVGTVMASIGYVFMLMYPYQMAQLFSPDDPAVVAMAAEALVIFFALIPLVGFQIICSNYFQAVGKPVQSIILSMSRQVLLFIPLLLILPNFFGIYGVWYTAPIADILSVLFTACFIFYEIRRFPKEDSVELEAFEALPNETIDNFRRDDVVECQASK